MREAEEQVLGYVREWVPEARKAPLCGNSIATDRGFLTRDMAELGAGRRHRRQPDRRRRERRRAPAGRRGEGPRLTFAMLSGAPWWV